MARFSGLFWLKEAVVEYKQEDASDVEEMPEEMAERIASCYVQEFELLSQIIKRT